MKTIEGGVCAAKGFTAAGVHCGIRKNKSKRDLALIYSSVPASAAAVYTTNLVKGAPLVVTKQHLSDGKAQAIICNSGNANTCNANGVEIAEQMSALLAQVLPVQAEDVVVASTGVIGQPLDIAPIAAGIPMLVKELGDHSEAAAEGIMTTDTKLKQLAVSFMAGGKECKLGGICKGSGMIHPNIVIRQSVPLGDLRHRLSEEVAAHEYIAVPLRQRTDKHPDALAKLSGLVFALHI